MNAASTVAPRPVLQVSGARFRAVSAAIFVALIMVSGGFIALTLGFHSNAVAPVGSAHPGVASVGVKSGPVLAHGPFTTNPTNTFANMGGVQGSTPLASNAPIHFSVGFQMRNQAQLEQILTGQSTPGSPLFHQWLTNAQEMQMFGPDPVEVQNTINYFTSQGFHVGTRGILSISFTGTAAQANGAFRTSISTVALQNGSTRTMNTVPLSLPSLLYPGVASVNGLDSGNTFHVTSFADPSLAGGVPVGAALSPSGMGGVQTAGQIYSNISTAYNVSNHAFIWFHILTPHKHLVNWQVLTPASLNYLYNATSLINQGYNGNSTGNPITIAIVMAGGINPSDLQGYSQLAYNNPYQIQHRLVPVPVDGSFTTNGTVTYTDGASGEMALDIEYSSTMAPGARIMPVYGPCLCTNVLDDDYATIWAMATTPNIISNSWGGDEDGSGNLYGPNFQNDVTMHNYFMLLDAKGATILASSADGGGFDKTTGILAGSFPATDPYVLSVDGLRTVATDYSNVPFPREPAYGLANISFLYPSIPPGYYENYPTWIPQADKILTQSYWYDPPSNTTLQTLPPSGSGGFGTSYWFNQSWFEHGYTIPDLGRSLGSGVAAEADFNQSIYFDGGFEWFYGGTSFACPTTAGELALIEDYVKAHGHNAYLGNGNTIVNDIGNAYYNGNLTLKPYYDVVGNGTSYWGNRGVHFGYSWPPGQNFPINAQGFVTYGNTTKGWDFPTGWGSMIVDNFAVDLNYLESLPGTFMTTNAAGTSWNSGGWGNLVTNQTYPVEVNATGVSPASNPQVTLSFLPKSGAPISTWQPAVTSTVTPSGGAGYKFTLDTSTGPITGPGTVIFMFGNSTTKTLGFSYSWVSAALPTGGNLTVQVVSPGGNSIVGGYPSFTTVPGLGLYFPPVTVFPSCCTAYPNTFSVLVTYAGKPVYNARVTAQVPSIYSLAWQGSHAQNATDSFGRLYEQSSQTISATFTNMTGIALVYTWNVVKPTTYFVNASYSTAKAGTTFSVVPGPNIKARDNYGGAYSSFNTVAFILQNLRQRVSPYNENYWVPNSVNQSDLYSLIYAWQGERLNLSVNDYTGQSMQGIHVWLGNLDTSSENKFYHYQGNGGLDGVTNTTGTSNITDFTGNTSVTIPDNQTDDNYFTYASGATAGFAFLAASVPGQFNRTSSYTEPCSPTNPTSSLINTITCQFNNTYQRNYTSVPVLILSNPIDAWTQTTSHAHQDFFGTGANISFGFNITLPSNDPFVNGFGFNWGNGLEHVTGAAAYVDGHLAANVNIPVPPYVQQQLETNGNLSGNYAPGIHTMTLVVTDSMGRVFTKAHTFVVGSVSMTNLGVSNTYLIIPYVLNWTLGVPSNVVNNHTFSQSLEIKYVSPGCGGTTNPCPVVVNLSKKILWNQIRYNQSINTTLLNMNHFYGGSGELPSGQYQVIVWLNANHSGSITAEVTTYFVYVPVNGQITGPSANGLVPIGNVTIAYTYSGGYVTNATLLVFSSASLTVPVFSVGAFVPGIGDAPRGGAAIWPAVQGGSYEIVLSLGTPYGAYNATELINVTATTGETYLNQTHQNGPLGSMNPAVIAMVLALVAAVIGVILGMYLAPTIRNGVGTNGATAPAPPVKPWEEKAGTPTAGNRCPICQDQFETTFALHQHQKIAHGIEE
jgi:kumamolisin